MNLKRRTIFARRLPITLAMLLVGCGSSRSNQQEPAAATDLVSRLSDEGVTVLVDSSDVKVAIPAGWKIKNDGGCYVAVTRDNALTVVFCSSRFAKFADAGVHSGDDLAKFVSKAKLAGPGTPWKLRDELNGISEAGAGEANGKAVKWSSLIIDAPRKPFLVFAFAEPDQFESHATDLGKVIMGIQRYSY